MAFKTGNRCQADKAFSLAIRTRDRWTCQHCDTDYQNDPGNLHCAHIIGRRVKATRWHPMNAVSLCASCHAWFTDRPLAFSSWLKTYLPDGHQANLDSISRGIGRNTANHKKMVAAHYRKQAKLLESGEIRDLEEYDEAA